MRAPARELLVHVPFLTPSVWHIGIAPLKRHGQLYSECKDKAQILVEQFFFCIHKNGNKDITNPVEMFYLGTTKACYYIACFSFGFWTHSLEMDKWSGFSWFKPGM